MLQTTDEKATNLPVSATREYLPIELGDPEAIAKLADRFGEAFRFADLLRGRLSRRLRSWPECCGRTMELAWNYTDRTGVLLCMECARTFDLRDLGL